MDKSRKISAFRIHGSGGEFGIGRALCLLTIEEFEKELILGSFDYMSEFELEPEFNSESTPFGDPGEVFDETDEMDLASRLLEIDNARELDQFLGGLIQRASRAMGRAIIPDARRALQDLLKRAAQKSIPFLGGAPGRSAAMPFDRQEGEPVETAERMFGLELEGLSAEDQEFEIARRFVRFAGSAARGAASGRGRPAARARRGVIRAARKLAPGLLRPRRQPAGGTSVSVQGGHWIRRGRNLLVINCGPPPEPAGASPQGPEPAQGGEPDTGTAGGQENLADEEF